MTTIVLSDKQRDTLLANASKMERRAAEIRSRVASHDENQHSKSAAEVIEILKAPSTAELFVDRAQELLIESPFSELESQVWGFVNNLLTHPDELESIDSDEVYSVVRRAIRQATKGWED